MALSAGFVRPRPSLALACIPKDVPYSGHHIASKALKYRNSFVWCLLVMGGDKDFCAVIFPAQKLVPGQNELRHVGTGRTLVAEPIPPPHKQLCRGRMQLVLVYCLFPRPKGDASRILLDAMPIGPGFRNQHVL